MHPVVELLVGEDARGAGLGVEEDVLGVVSEGVGHGHALVVDLEAAENVAGIGFDGRVGVAGVDEVEDVAGVVAWPGREVLRSGWSSRS